MIAFMNSNKDKGQNTNVCIEEILFLPNELKYCLLPALPPGSVCKSLQITFNLVCAQQHFLITHTMMAIFMDIIHMLIVTISSHHVIIVWLHCFPY